MKKKILLICIPVLLCGVLSAQSSTAAQWVRHSCGLRLNDQSFRGNLYGDAACADRYGNSYNAGAMSGTAFTMDTLIYYMNGHTLFFIKYNSSGERLWTKSFGGKTPNSLVIVNRMKCDEPGNVYMCGNLSPDAGDTIVIGNYRITRQCGFIAKFNSQGDNIWCITSQPSGIGGATIAFYDLSIGNDRLYACGDMNFGKLIFGGRMFSNKFSLGAFTCGLSLTGRVFTARLLDTNSANQAFGIEVSKKTNKVYVVGGYLGPGNFTVDALSVPLSKFNFNSYVLQTDPLLKSKWLINGVTYSASSGVTGSYKKALSQVELDNSDNVYAVGNAPGDSTRFGNLSFSHETSTAYKQDLYIVKFTREGIPVWMKAGRSKEMDFVTDIATDPAGNSIITVGSGVNATGGLIFGTDTIPQSFSGLVKYDASGNIVYTKALQEIQTIKQISLASDSAFVITGTPFRRGRPFDTILINDCESTQFGSTISNSMFMAAFTQQDQVTFANKAYGKNLLKGVVLYPNPTSGIVRVSVNDNPHQKLFISVFSRDNRLVYNKVLLPSYQVMDLSGLPAGYYICRIENGLKQKTSVIIFKQ